MREGDWVRAETLLEHSLRGFVAVEEKIGIADGLEAMAALRAARGSAERAARISGAVAVLRESIGAHPFPFDHVIWQHYLVSAREQLGAVAWTTAWEEGRALSLDQAVAAALRRHA